MDLRNSSMFILSNIGKNVKYNQSVEEGFPHNIEFEIE